MAELQPALDGPELALGPGIPHTLPEGDYRITFELRLMSDAIVIGQPREYGVGATCDSTFEVGSGTSVIRIRVAFGVDACSASVH